LIPCAYVRVLEKDGRRIVVARQPPGCTPGPWTLEESVRVEVVEREVRGDYCLVYRPVKAVFPRRACELLDEIESGGTPRVLLLGPPGTGKSLFAKLVARVAPVYVVEIEPEAILSKYVGESEQKLRRYILEAEANQPSIIVADEADILVSERREGGESDGMARVSASLVRMLLRKLQEWSDRRARVGFIASSNKSIRDIDTALVRAERAEVVYFPVPTREAVKLLAGLYGRSVSDEEAKNLLRRALSFANIVEYLRTGRVREFQPVTWAYLEYGERVRLNLKLSEDARLVIAEEPPLGYKLAALVSASVYDRPVILLTDPRRWQDLFWLGRSMELPIAIPYSVYLEPVNVTSYDYPYPVFYVGAGWRLPHLRLDYQALEALVQGGGRELAKALGCPRARSKNEVVRCLSGVESRS